MLETLCAIPWSRLRSKTSGGALMNEEKGQKMTETIKQIVTEYYLKSHDFNGIQIWNLISEIGKEGTEIKESIFDLVRSESIGIIDEKTDPNPNIIRTGFEPLESQLEKASANEPGYMCLYPKKSILEKIVNPDDYKTEPYKLRLALGEPQLSYVSFDLSVLEFYRNDPRYRYENDDIQGHIYYDEEQMPERDKAFLETYGFAYDKELNRAVAVFLRYLADLTPEHQQIWKAKELSDNYKLHPDYYRNTIIGDWGERVPICQALMEELYIINRMSEAMGRPPLFRNDYGEYGADRPKRFHFLIRPTLEEFNSFVLLFDKMLSDNINKDFFMNEISYENEQERDDGKIIVSQKGTLQLLDDWVRKFFKPSDWSVWDEAIASLKKVRKLRQEPAHAIKEDVFDQKYFKDQRELIMNAYNGIRTIRLIFANHPKVKIASIDIPDWLQKGKIWNI